ncbi:MAG: DUF2309 domain-containing protein [Deltaproteobacteria bacterium]|nr:DUF2309 domain-containing protein [Deltaproteobacteria bacterium]
MEKIGSPKHNLARSAELHTAVRLAGEAIAYYYPMCNFVHHNPLHGFEDIKFEEAVRQGRRLFGANEHISEETFMGYLASGKIEKRHLHRFIEEKIRLKGITGHATAGGRKISALDAIKAVFERKGALDGTVTDKDFLEKISKNLSAVIPAYDPEKEVQNAMEEGKISLWTCLTVASWCDSVLFDKNETTLSERIDTELIRLCEGFFDEGHGRWDMPAREKGLYGAWRRIAARGINRHGIKDIEEKIKCLPIRPEDCIAECLDALGVPEDAVQPYISLHLASLAGWAGLIKWREDHPEYDWQQACPASLVDYVAIRLWYEKELSSIACEKTLGIKAHIGHIREYMTDHSLDYFFRLEHFSKRALPEFSDEVERIVRFGSRTNACWNAIKEDYFRATAKIRTDEKLLSAARHLAAFAENAGIDKSDILGADTVSLKTIIDWMTVLNYSERGLIWLKSLEATYQENLINRLKDNLAAQNGNVQTKRPSTQSLFCIDVRSEPFRRHLEGTGAHETYGFAGFFAAFIKFRAHGSGHETDQFPVVMNARNKVKEIARANQEDSVYKRKARRKLGKTGYNILHDLKEDIITPYVMVESIGWFYSIPILGKSWTKWLYKKASAWITGLWLPQIRTVVTTDRLTKEEAEEILAQNQRTVIRRALKQRFADRGIDVSNAFIENMRLRAMEEELGVLSTEEAEGRFSETEISRFIHNLQEKHKIGPRWSYASMSKIMQHGFTHEEQVFTVETILRATGLTTNFARLVMLCGHGSTTENNPFEAALDCGACGGNSGSPNARVAATMANKRAVRDALKERGIVIPDDTHFIPALHNTTTDEISLFDIEDMPESHRKDLENLKKDLLAAGKLTCAERCSRLPDIAEHLEPEKAWDRIKVRSADWSQVRPEWGLSGNAAFIIGRRRLTGSLDLGGRVFLHSYDHSIDKGCKALEVIMTAPQVVAQWINMEHYFSTIDNDVYGSGSKIYHNITGRNAIMFGTQSDLRAGLPLQTVMNGDKPFHEPMRLVSIIEAPKDDILNIVKRHPVLQNFYDKEWVYLVSIDPVTGEFNRYVADKGWEPC